MKHRRGINVVIQDHEKLRTEMRSKEGEKKQTKKPQKTKVICQVNNVIVKFQFKEISFLIRYIKQSPQ